VFRTRQTTSFSAGLKSGARTRLTNPRVRDYCAAASRYRGEQAAGMISAAGQTGMSLPRRRGRVAIASTAEVSEIPAAFVGGRPPLGNLAHLDTQLRAWVAFAARASSSRPPRWSPGVATTPMPALRQADRLAPSGGYAATHLVRTVRRSSTRPAQLRLGLDETALRRLGGLTHLGPEEPSGPRCGASVGRGVRAARGRSGRDRDTPPAWCRA
jgi:hypothetical protein